MRGYTYDEKEFLYVSGNLYRNRAVKRFGLEQQGLLRLVYAAYFAFVGQYIRKGNGTSAVFIGRDPSDWCMYITPVICFGGNCIYLS